MSNYNSNCCQSYEYRSDGCSACDASYTQTRQSSCMCSMRVICLFVLLFAFAVGLIIGAVFAPLIWTALSAIIVFAIIMAIAIFALLLYRRCSGCCRFGA